MHIIGLKLYTDFKISSMFQRRRAILRESQTQRGKITNTSTLEVQFQVL
jgi:hypothetical protein